MPVITEIEDLRQLAKRRVPRMFYDYADSGSWTEQTYRRNESDFDKIRLRQIVAKNMEGRKSSQTNTCLSLSSRNNFVWVLPVRAVTRQSMLRISSPGWYSLDSSNSIPLPLKGDW